MRCWGAPISKSTATGTRFGDSTRPPLVIKVHSTVYFQRMGLRTVAEKQTSVTTYEITRTTRAYRNSDFTRRTPHINALINTLTGYFLDLDVSLLLHPPLAEDATVDHSGTAQSTRLFSSVSLARMDPSRRVPFGHASIPGIIQVRRDFAAHLSRRGRSGRSVRECKLWKK